MNRKIICCVMALLVTASMLVFSSCGEKKYEQTGVTEAGTTALPVSAPVSQFAEFSAASASDSQTTAAASAVQTTAVSTTAAETKNAVSSTTDAPATTQPQNQSAGPVTGSDMSIRLKGVSVRPGQDWESLSSSLGSPVSVQQAPSCHYDGMDNIYEYSGFSIYTYQSASREIVYDIVVTSSSYSTGRGIAASASAEDVVNAYGGGYANKTDSVIEYRSGSDSLYFNLSGGVVTSVELYCD